MSFLIKMFGAEFNPYVHIFSSLHLPIVDGLHDIWAADMREKEEKSLYHQHPETKKYRIAMKNARREEQEDRKQWTKRQRIIHSYGTTEEDDFHTTTPIPTPSTQQQDVGLSDDALVDIVQAEQTPHPSADLVVVTNCKGTPPTPQKFKRCKCGSSTHQRTSSKQCPLNAKNQ
jgi:hypothetical protein